LWGVDINGTRTSLKELAERHEWALAGCWGRERGTAGQPRSAGSREVTKGRRLGVKKGRTIKTYDRDFE